MSLKDLFPIFANNIFPIMLISLAGFVLGRTIKIDTRSIGRVSFYFFNPVLVFNILLANKLPVTEMLNTAVFTILVTLGSGLIALLGGQILKLDKKTQISTLLTSMFANNGNYGLPLIAFAFGEQALSHASLYFVFASLITNTLGIFIASMGHMSIKQAFLGIFRIPTIYAVMAALLINSLTLTMPLPIERTVSILTGAGVPVMILLLGLELSNMKWTNSFKALGLAASVRLIAGPLLGVGFAALLGMQGVGMKAGIVDASMSSAVANANLASEYELDSSLVAATILVTTLLSPLTLTPLILLLG
jgi:predicted permease